MKKQNLILQAALVAAFAAASSSAFAVVTLSPTVASTPAKYASELVSTANVTLNSLVTGALSLAFSPAWGVAAGNHLYVRIDLTNAKFLTPLTAGELTSTNHGPAVSSLSAGGGAGQSFVIYDMSSPTGILLSDVITLATPDLTYVSPTSAATVKVNVYDSASLANAGANGLGFTLNDNYVSITPALSTTFTPATNTASVAASFKNFLANSPTGTPAAATTIQLGQVQSTVSLTALKPATSAAVVAADFATASDLVVTGVFGAVGLTGNVFLDSSASCATGPGTNLVLNTAKTTATATGFAGVPLVAVKPYVCLLTDGTTAVPAQTVTGALTFTGQQVGAIVPGASGTVGNILHDGTELQTPWFSTAAGYTSRIFLTNTGSTAANISGYTILTETGNTCTPGTGRPTSIPANSMVSISGASLCSSFSAASRAAVIITIEQPTTQIQGVYQIINPTTAAQTAYPMLRPGTN
jgi:hypothetical protein